MKVEQIREILALYRKHGWTLRRVLLSDTFRVELNDLLAELFGGVPVVSSELNALWFSRVSRPDQEAWELRRLTASPFALTDVFDVDEDEEVRAEALTEMESRMKEN